MAMLERQDSIGSDDEADARVDSDGEDAVEGQEKKSRFVWTTDLHHRFEQAVLRLGVGLAKPQAIRQLMGCDTEDEPPTRQNIKSHLQKYRLFVQKQQGSKPPPPSQHMPQLRVASPSGAPPASARGGAGSGGGGACGGAGVGGSCVADGGSEHGGAEVHMSQARYRQQLQAGLQTQIDTQGKLHEQMHEQRRTQAALAWHLAQLGDEPALGLTQLQRLAQHVLMQRMMLQHLCSMLHATSVDLANDQMRVELGGGAAEDVPNADVFGGVGLDESGAMAFPFDLPEQPEPGMEPFHHVDAMEAHGSYSHIEVGATPLQSEIVPKIEPLSITSEISSELI